MKNANDKKLRQEIREPAQDKTNIEHIDPVITNQRNTGTAISESEKKYRSLFENMLNGFAYCRTVFDDDNNLVDFIYLDVNSAFERLTGFKHAVGKRVSELIPGIRENDPELFDIYGRVALTGKPEIFEMLIESLSMWISVSVYSPEKGYFVATFDVITDRKIAEIERENNIRLLEIINLETDLDMLMTSLINFLHEFSGCDAVGIRLQDGDDFPYYKTKGFSDDFITSDAHLCAKDLNGKIMCDETGKPVLECVCGNVLCGRFDPAEPFFTGFGSFISNNISEFLSLTTGDENRQVRMRNQCSMEGYESVFIVPVRTGKKILGLLQFNNYRKECFSERFISQVENFSKNIAGAVAQRKAEKALRESEKKYRRLAENSPDVIYRLSLPERKYEYVSPAVTNIFGYPPEAWYGNKNLIEEIIHPDWYPYLEKQRQQLRKEQIPPIYEYQIVHKNGEVRWINQRNMPVKDADGRLIAIEGIVTDITRRKQMEEQLLQSQKMEAIGTLAGGIAHDFNNILTIFTGNISYALSIIDKDHELFEILSDVLKGTKQAKNLTDQLLTFAKGGKPIKSVTDINKLLMESAGFVTSGSKSKCDFNLAEGLWTAEIDSGQINQVISNIVINADQAMPNGGIITLKSENREMDADNEFHLPAGQYIKISIEDKGIGIQEKHLSNIFDPYFTTKQKGNGLGLATAYSIIKQHGGHIMVYSKLGQGTVFYIYLPTSTQKIIIAEDRDQSEHHGRGKILIMDDQEPILKVISRILNRMGYETEAVTDGAKAVEVYGKAFEDKTPFDFVILDLTIPGGMGGAETIQALLKINPNVKAVASSGYSNNPVMANYQDYGFCGVAPKPYTKEHLAQLLNRILGEKG